MRIKKTAKVDTLAVFSFYLPDYLLLYDQNPSKSVFSC